MGWRNFWSIVPNPYYHRQRGEEPYLTSAEQEFIQHACLGSMEIVQPDRSELSSTDLIPRADPRLGVHAVHQIPTCGCRPNVLQETPDAELEA